VARVLGIPEAAEFVCETAIQAEAGGMGLREVDPEGLAARTRFRVIETFGDGTTLLEARPESGRTNQIRVQLWDRGLPVCGDPAYLPERRKGGRVTLEPGEGPMALHAWRLGLRHPVTGQWTEYEAPLPEWAVKAEALERSL